MEVTFRDYQRWSIEKDKYILKTLFKKTNGGSLNIVFKKDTNTALVFIDPMNMGEIKLYPIRDFENIFIEFMRPPFTVGMNLFEFCRSFCYEWYFQEIIKDCKITSRAEWFNS